MEAGERRVVLSIPWRMLVRDNAKYGVSRGKMILTEKYRNAKEAAYAQACVQVRGARPVFTEAVRLVARMYFPDRRRKRDVGNYRKLVTDALQGVVYPDDSLIHDERWVNAGTDAERPRCELTIEPLVAA